MTLFTSALFSLKPLKLLAVHGVVDVGISGGGAKRDADSSFYFVTGSRPSISIVWTRELNACQYTSIETCVRFSLSDKRNERRGKHNNPRRNISVDRLWSITILFILVGSTNLVCRFPLQRRVRDRYFEIESGNETRRPTFGTSASLIITSVGYSLNYPMWGSIDWHKSNYKTSNRLINL